MTWLTSIHVSKNIYACFIIYFCNLYVVLITSVGATTTPRIHTSFDDGFGTKTSTEDTMHFTPPHMTTSPPELHDDNGYYSGMTHEGSPTTQKQITTPPEKEHYVASFDGYIFTPQTSLDHTTAIQETEPTRNLAAYGETTPETDDEDAVFNGEMIPQPLEDSVPLDGNEQFPGLFDDSQINLVAQLTQPLNDVPVITTIQSSTENPDQLAVAEPNSISKTAITPPLSSTNVTITIVSNAGLQHHQLNSLLESLLVGYDRRIRPRNNQVSFVTIFSDIVPQSIIEFDTHEQRFSLTGYFKMDWRDEFLTWDPTVYEDTRSLRIPVKSIWIPKLFIDKSYGGNGQVGDQNTDIALVSYRGFVRWFPEGRYSVVCKVTIRFFPFDIQNCTFSYYIADEDNSTINLKHYGTIDLSEYIENAEWKLNSLTATREQVDDRFIVNYQFIVERRGGFAMFTLVVPVLMLSMLSGATFLIPIETGEKCSFSVTVFLAYGIFETVVIDTLPHNSMDVSFFILYLTSLLIVSVLLTFYTILQTKIFDALGDRKFRFCLCGKQGDGITWGRFLRKLDTYMFVLFLIFVLVLTSIFIAAMRGRVDFL